MEKNNKSSSFSRLGGLIASLSSALGLGNIWKFSTVAGQSGGSAFVLIFILSAILASLPVFLVEFYVGKKTQKTPVPAFDELTKTNGKGWRFIPMLGFISTAMVIFFYSDVIGWVVKYFWMSLTGQIQVSTMEEAKAIFGSVVSSPVSVVFCQILVLAFVSCVSSMGIVDSINKAVKYSVSCLGVILLFLLCNSLTMSGTGEAFKFLFVPDFSKITGKVMISALGFAFFKMSLGFTAQMSYFTYYPDDVNIGKTAVSCILSDVIVSILCGIVIFPIVFTFGLEPQAGPGLIFMTLPLAFAKMKFGRFFMTLFFALVMATAFGAILSLMNTTTAFFKDKFNLTIKKASMINCVVSVVFGLLASLSTTDVLSSVQIFGMGFFDLFDYVSSNILLPVSCLVLVGFVMYFLKKEDVVSFMNKYIPNKKITNFWYVFTKYCTTLLIILIGINSMF